AARHRVPLIANAPRVAHEGKLVIAVLHGQARRRRYETGLTVRMIAAAVCEPARSAAVSRVRYRPLYRCELVIRLLAQRCETADVECTRAGIISGGQCGVLAKDIASARIRERFAESHAPCDFGDDPPIRLGLAG